MENTASVEEYGYAKDGKVFLKGYLDYPDREIGVVRNTEAEALQYFQNRFKIAEQKVLQLEKEIEEAQNKGSYLTKLLQLRKTLVEFDGLGDFIPLLEKLDALETYLRELIKVNQAKNLEIKRALIEEVRAIQPGDEEWNDATQMMQEIKTKWLKTGPVEKQYEEEVEGTFLQLTDEFFQHRREFFAEKNRLIDERLATLQQLVDGAFALRRKDDLDAAFQEIRQMQAQWKTIGQVPPKKQSMLWKQFKKANDLFFEKYNATKGIVPKPRIDPRIALLEGMANEAETLTSTINQAAVLAAASRAKELLVQWKENATKVKTLDRQVSERFRLACDKIFEMNYLRRVIGYRYPDFDDKPRRDQLKIQIYQMEYLVRKEKADLGPYLDGDGSLNRYSDADKLALQKINTQRRKVAVKEMLLTEFKRELETIL